MDARLGLAALLLLALPILYNYAASSMQARLPMLRNRRICLLIAHPDDEAMFFAPTILALTKPGTGNHIKILCLSTGNADGLGETRKKELKKSGLALGLQDEDDVFVIDDDDFPDSMTTTWDKNKIAKLLGDAFIRPRPDGSGLSSAIDVLLTFDGTGVSSHPNHISLYHGSRTFINFITKVGPSPVALYTLKSVGILRKYASFLDALPTLAGFSASEGPLPSRLAFLSQLMGDGAGWGVAWRVMTEAHKSQMVWFRYGWITFSRYMVINDLQLEKADPEE